MIDSRRLVLFLRDPLNLPPLAYLLLWGSVALFARPAGDFGVETDFYGDFAHYSRIWMEDGPTLMNGFRGPFYYILLGVTGKLLGDPFLAAKVLSVLGASLGLAFLGRIIRKLWDTPRAMVAMLFVGSNPIFVEYSYRACSDPVFWCLFTGTILLLFTDSARPALFWAAAGLTAGLAYLTRYNGVGLVPAVFLAAAVGQRPWSRSALRFAAFFGVWLVVIAPWALFLLAETGDPLWNKNFANVAVNVLVDNPGVASTGAFMSEVLFTSFSEVIRVDPQAFLRVLGRNLGEHAWLDVRQLLTLPWAVAGLLGLMLGARGWMTRRRLAFAAMALATYFILLPVFYNPRFMIPLLIWWGAAAGGCVELARWLPRKSASTESASNRAATRAVDRKKRGVPRSKPRRVFSPWQPAWIVVVVFAAGFVIASGINLRVSQDDFRHGGLANEIHALADQVHANGYRTGRNTPVAALKPHIGYYLDSPVIRIAEGGVENIRASGAHYLLISGIEARRIPSLNRFWVPQDSESVPRGLRLAGVAVHLIGGNQRRAATLYAVDDPLPYTHRESSPLVTARDPEPGFSRIDDLRLSTVGWYVRWNSNPHDQDRLLDLIDVSHQEKAVVLAIRGDIALERGDFAEAGKLFGRALSLAPERQELILRLATSHYLAGDDAAFEAGVARYLAESGLDPESSGLWWVDQAVLFIGLRDFSAAYALAAKSVVVPEPHVVSLKILAYCYEGLGSYEEAAGLLRRYLQQIPDDPEAIGFLQFMEERQ